VRVPLPRTRNYGQSTTGALFDQALGCTRFRAALMRACPAAISGIGADAIDVHRERDWRGLDGRITGALRQGGYEPHVHWPAVDHHHEYPMGCACGREHE